jgi:hypothetical protein
LLLLQELIRIRPFGFAIPPQIPIPCYLPPNPIEAICVGNRLVQGILKYHNSFVDNKFMLSVLFPVLWLFALVFFVESTAKALLLKFIRRKKKEDNNRLVHQMCFE